MLKITEVFNDEIIEIKQIIANIAVEGCIDKYSKYLEYRSTATGIEAKFLNRLNYNKVNFTLNLLRSYYSKKNKEEILNILIKGYNDGIWELGDRCYSEEMSDVLNIWFKDADIHKDIIKEMHETLDFIEAEANTTTEQQEQNRIQQEIDNCNYTMKESEKAIINSKEKIAELEKKLIK